MKPSDSLSLLGDVVAKARAAGADAADAVLVASSSQSASCRLGTVEHMERSESADIGLRVLVGKRQAVVSSSDCSEQTLDELVERAVAMARVVPEDPFCGLADENQIALEFPDIDSCDSVAPDAETLIARALECEDAARAVPGITNSEGAGASWGRSDIAAVASNGFSRAYALSRHSIGVAVLAGEGAGMERDYDHSSAVYAADLSPAAEIGRNAAERTIRRLGARKVETCSVPVVFESRVARGLLSHLAGAINGVAIARGTSFLKDCLNKTVFASNVRIVDDPLRARGLRSRPCDGEGLPTRPIAVVEDGVLKSWLLDLRSARQLEMASTGHASRGVGSPPSPAPSNLYLEAGKPTLDEMIKGIHNGFLITELSGQGINMITGDYSRGAVGFWIEGGEIAYPVSEVTIAGNLKDMFKALTPANDLRFIYGIDSPSVRIDGMTIAGR